MKLLAIFSLILFLSSTSYQPYVDSFEKRLGKKISTTISIVPKFSDSTINPKAIGVCYYAYPRKIELLQSYWRSASNTTRKILIYHELGHCELNRDHFDKQEQDFNLSIMRYMIMYDYQYKYCEKEYDEELFTYDFAPLLKCIDRYYIERKK